MYNTTTRSYTLQDASGSYNWIVDGLKRTECQNMTDEEIGQWIDTHVGITQDTAIHDLMESIEEMTFPRLGYTVGQRFETAEEYEAFKREEIASDLKADREIAIQFVKNWIAGHDPSLIVAERNFINTDDRYGGPEVCNLQDYVDRNPSGEFYEDDDGIYEVLPSGKKQIAVKRDSEPESSP